MIPFIFQPVHFGQQRTIPFLKLSNLNSGILNAMLVPESLRRTLYPSMSPVNTFRILLHGLFGEDLMPIRDRAFYSWYDEGSPAATDGDPARMYEVTTVLLSHGSSDGRQSGG